MTSDKRLSPATCHLSPVTLVDELKPCQFRQVDNHGRILCNVIKGGDREVSVNLCRACPVSQINCQNLRAGLEKKVSTPITVRFATGRVEVWDDLPASVEFKQAACAAKTMPIHSPRDCAGCPIRVPNVIPQNAIQVAHRSKPNVVAAQNAVAAQATVPQHTAPAAQPMAQSAAQPIAQQVAPQPVARQTVTQTARSVAAPVQAKAVPTGIDVGAANDLIARAKATAARKAEEKRQRELERAALEQARQRELERIALEQARQLEIERLALQEAQRLEAERVALEQVQQREAKYNTAPASDGKPKIIQMKEWLKEQATKKQKSNTPSPYKPQAITPDADGVSDIVYSPLGAQTAMAYQETIDYERCVGWTD